MINSVQHSRSNLPLKKKYCCETSLNLDYPSNAMHVLLY
uniref:Uncharacterized protein n=1 Tax=Salmonella phage PMBT36 TaxID=3229746 RepID=A0AB39C1B4_9CAUD